MQHAPGNGLVRQRVWLPIREFRRNIVVKPGSIRLMIVLHDEEDMGMRQLTLLELDRVHTRMPLPRQERDAS